MDSQSSDDQVTIYYSYNISNVEYESSQALTAQQLDRRQRMDLRQDGLASPLERNEPLGRVVIVHGTCHPSSVSAGRVRPW